MSFDQSLDGRKGSHRCLKGPGPMPLTKASERKTPKLYYSTSPSARQISPFAFNARISSERRTDELKWGAQALSIPQMVHQLSEFPRIKKELVEDDIAWEHTNEANQTLWNAGIMQQSTQLLRDDLRTHAALTGPVPDDPFIFLQPSAARSNVQQRFPSVDFRHPPNVMPNDMINAGQHEFIHDPILRLSYHEQSEPGPGSPSSESPYWYPERACLFTNINPFASAQPHQSQPLSPPLSPKAKLARDDAPAVPASRQKRPTQSKVLRKWSPTRIRKLCRQGRPANLPEDIDYDTLDTVEDVPLERLIPDWTEVKGRIAHFEGPEGLQESGQQDQYATVDVKVQIGGRGRKLKEGGLDDLVDSQWTDRDAVVRPGEDGDPNLVPFQLLTTNAQGEVILDATWYWKADDHNA